MAWKGEVARAAAQWKHLWCGSIVPPKVRGSSRWTLGPETSQWQDRATNTPFNSLAWTCVCTQPLTSGKEDFKFPLAVRWAYCCDQHWEKPRGQKMSRNTPEPWVPDSWVWAGIPGVGWKASVPLLIMLRPRKPFSVEAVWGKKMDKGTAGRADAAAALCWEGILLIEDLQAVTEGRNGEKKDTDLRSKCSFNIWVWLIGPFLQFKLSNCFRNGTCLQQGFAPIQWWIVVPCRRGDHATPGNPSCPLLSPDAAATGTEQ